MKSPSVSEAARSLRDALATEAAARETMAREGAELARAADQGGDPGLAATLRFFTRHTRVRALELSGTEAALGEVLAARE
jgi:hypothetical protein